jgi:hypothetical protein
MPKPSPDDAVAITEKYRLCVPIAYGPTAPIVVVGLKWQAQ